MSVAIVQACTLLHRAEAAGSNKSRLQTPGFRLQEKKRPGKASDLRLQASGEDVKKRQHPILLLLLLLFLPEV
jgi:hypothetical protein